MKFANKFKISVAKRVLKRIVSSKNKQTQVCNINDAKSIGVVFNATNTASYEIIKEFAKKLNNKNIKVSALGFVNSKKMIDHYLFRKGFDFFTKKDLNWYDKPIGSSIGKFIEKPFNILINLSLEDYFPIEYIVALSKSTLKVGKYKDDDISHDIMIDIENEKKTMDNIKSEILSENKASSKKRIFEHQIDKKVEAEIQLNFLIDQIMHYLTVIKSN